MVVEETCERLERQNLCVFQRHCKARLLTVGFLTSDYPQEHLEQISRKYLIDGFAGKCSNVVSGEATRQL